MFNLKNTNKEEGVLEKNFESNNFPIFIIFAMIFLSPVIFLPASITALTSIKFILLYATVLISLFIFVMFKIRSKSLSLPLNLLSISTLTIPLIYLISGIFSKNIKLSFFSRDFSVDSVLTILIMFLLLLLTAMYVNTKSKVIYAYFSILGSFIILATLHILNIAIPALPSLGIFSSPVSTTLGNWNDLALVSAFAVVFSMISILLIRPIGILRTVLYIALTLGIILNIVVSFTLSWYILGIFSIFVFIYISVINKSEEKGSTFPIMPLVVFLLSFLFIFSGNIISGQIHSFLGISYFEVRPSLDATFDIAKNNILSRPILGSGPGFFESEWAINRPNEILSSNFWNLDFKYGFGFIPSLISTTGVLGLLSWIFFLGIFIVSGINILFKKKEKNLMFYLLSSSFIVSLMLWMVLSVYLPGVYIILLTFVMTGIYMSLLFQNKILKVKNINLKNSPRIDFVYITLLVFILIGIIATGYITATRFTGQLYFRQALQEINTTGDLDRTEQLINSALRLEENDTYFRSLAEIGIVRINSIINDSTKTKEAVLDQFKKDLLFTVNNYQAAINYDNLNYLNYLSIANLYKDLAVINIEGSYEQAQNFYNKTLTLKKDSPDVYLQLANLEIIKGDTGKAKEYISKALYAKSNYVDAVVLFAKIELEAGNINEAVSALEVALNISPNDPNLLYQVGLVYYENKDFANAVSKFERGLQISPDFQNIKYFLGLSYSKVGNNDKAIEQFSDLSELNPQNQEIQQILNDLRSGVILFEDKEIDDEVDSEEKSEDTETTEN